MSVIIFILVLGLLIFVHELGHFLVAKKAGIRVDEFAIGFPPKLFSYKRGGTTYSLNLIPFGGYVKIYGETPDDGATDKTATDSMINKPRSTQALVLVAGVVFNFLLAVLIFSFLFMRGVEFDKTLVPYAYESSAVRVQHVESDSLADKAGIKVKDTVFALQLAGEDPTDDNDMILEKLYNDKKVDTLLVMERDGEQYLAELWPEREDMKFGMMLSDTVYIKTNPVLAVKYGFLATGHMVKLTAVGLVQFFGQLFTGRADFQEVAGPVGIAGLVGDAAESGLNDLLILTAIISINLGVLNLMPFPALDGGRLLVVGIESIIRRNLDFKKVAIVNLVGFALLIGLMILLTFHDIRNIFN